MSVKRRGVVQMLFPTSPSSEPEKSLAESAVSTANMLTGYENRGKCWKEKCYPKTIASKCLIKNNNVLFLRFNNETNVLAVNMRTRRSLYSKKQTKFLDLTVRNEKLYSCKCRWYKSINGTCIRHKSNKIKRQKGIRVSEDVVADLWKIQRVCDMIKSQDNVERFQDESVNIEKLVQEETTSSSYVDAKNCFVQDAYTQSVCKNEEKDIDEFRKSDEDNESSNHRNKINIKKQTISNENSTDLLFNFYKDAKEIQNKYEKTSLNCDYKYKKSVNVETSTCLGKKDKSSTIAACTVSKNDTDLPYIPELELKEIYDCNSTCNCEYQFSEERFGDYDIEEKNKFEIWKKCNRKMIPKISKQNRMLDTRNQSHWNLDITNPSYCENNRHVYNELRSSTSTESPIYPQAKMKITRTSSHDRGYLLFLKRLERIRKDPRRKKNNSVIPLIRRINIKEDYSDRKYNDRSVCRCQCFHRDIKRKMIIEDKFEDTETSRSKTSSSSTSLSSNDYNRSSRSFLYNNNCKCQYLSTVTSSTSSCTCTSTDLQSEIEYKGIEKKLSKIHYPLNPCSSTIIYNDNNNNYYNNSNKNSSRHFNVMRLYCQKTLSLMHKRLQNREKWINDHTL
ncbi:anaphase-promoting complex subunit 5-like isoform X2 [Vespula squamosa]|uniref:Anaphase-promoting complex subunit 5-like isoform X2 n=1 Tax=Vespula squamosa TaxID=30214 RepID=A0ABD1ZWD4_VESSQ